MLRIVVTAALAGLLAQPLGFARGAPSAGEGQAPPTFEVASIKQNVSGVVDASVSFEPGGGVRFVGFRVINLILGAFDNGTIQMRAQIVGGPSWIYSDRFDIVAKADGDLQFNTEGRRPARGVAMMKALLEERFAVKVHTETRRLAAFALKLARKDRRPGARLHESTVECPRYATGAESPLNADPDRWCGFRHVTGSVTAHHVTMGEVATFFASFGAVDRPIEDRTDLKGRYDLQVEFAESPDAGESASLLTAFREQLGLRFEREQATLPVIVIDHVERPTAD